MSGLVRFMESEVCFMDSIGTSNTFQVLQAIMFSDYLHHCLFYKVCGFRCAEVITLFAMSVVLLGQMPKYV